MSCYKTSTAHLLCFVAATSTNHPLARGTELPSIQHEHQNFYLFVNIQFRCQYANPLSICNFFVWLRFFESIVLVLLQIVPLFSFRKNVRKRPSYGSFEKLMDAAALFALFRDETNSLYYSSLQSVLLIHSCIAVELLHYMSWYRKTSVSFKQSPTIAYFSHNVGANSSTSSSAQQK